MNMTNSGAPTVALMRPFLVTLGILGFLGTPAAGQVTVTELPGLGGVWAKPLAVNDGRGRPGVGPGLHRPCRPLVERHRANRLRLPHGQVGERHADRPWRPGDADLQPVGGAPDGSFVLIVSLESRRDGKDRDGRTYTLTITATDNNGNTASVSAPAVAVHDQRR